jgi:hypothetical protein
MPELLGKMLQATPAAPALINAGVRRRQRRHSPGLSRAGSGFETARDLAGASLMADRYLNRNSASSPPTDTLPDPESGRPAQDVGPRRRGLRA